MAVVPVVGVGVVVTVVGFVVVGVGAVVTVVGLDVLGVVVALPPGVVVWVVPGVVVLLGALQSCGKE